MDFPVDLSPPLIAKARELNISPEDIEESFVRGSGPGGQKINKTANCVYLHHVPTGTTVKCQRHRERLKNRLSAYKLLILKIEDQIKGEESERAKKIHKLKKQKQKRTKRAKEKMLQLKKQRSEIKETRKAVSPPEK